MDTAPTSALFEAARKSRLDASVQQCGSLFRMLQYALPHNRTLAYAKPGMQALDWGCENGHFSYFLTSHGVRTTGYSFKKMPEYLKHEPLYKFVQGNPDSPVRLPFEDASFDLVFSIGVLEHVHETGGDQVASMVEIKRILKPSGVFLCFHLPNVGSWVEQLAHMLNKIKPKAYYAHSKRFSLSGVNALAVQSNLELLEFGRYNIMPRNVFGGFAQIASHVAIANGLQKVDEVISKIMPTRCQQIYFIARKA